VAGRRSRGPCVDTHRTAVSAFDTKDPAVVVTTDEETWADIASGRISASSGAATGALTVAGDPQAVKRLGKIFSRNQMLAQAEAR
jgi:putative sterol carrier protein